MPQPSCGHSNFLSIPLRLLRRFLEEPVAALFSSLSPFSSPSALSALVLLLPLLGSSAATDGDTKGFSIFDCTDACSSGAWTWLEVTDGGVGMRVVMT